MRHPQAIVGHFKGGWDEAAIQRWAAALRSRLDTPTVSLGILFATPSFAEHATDLLEIIRLRARIPCLVGCSTRAVIVNEREFESGEGLSLGLYHLQGAELQALHIDPTTLADPPSAATRLAGIVPSSSPAPGWLVFADPFESAGEQWLQEWNRQHPGVPVVGGLASGDPNSQRTQVFLDGTAHESGVVALAVGGAVRLEPVISQGCTPIGEIWTVTRTDRNFIVTIGNRPAYSVLIETFNGLSKEDQVRTQGNLFVGFAGTEYRDEFRRGDFLVRNLLGADPRHGVIAVGALPRAGQTIQFQRRDAAAASEELAWLLARTRERLAGRRVFGGVLGVCLGRGENLFGNPNHDAALIQEQLGPLPVAGFYCNGEIGPVGDRSFVHGYTAALALFVQA